MLKPRADLQQGSNFIDRCCENERYSHACHTDPWVRSQYRRKHRSPYSLQRDTKSVWQEGDLKDAHSDEGYLHINSDFTNPNSVSSAFDKLKAAFGPPSVVVYNGMHPLV